MIVACHLEIFQHPRRCRARHILVCGTVLVQLHRHVGVDIRLHRRSSVRGLECLSISAQAAKTHLWAATSLADELQESPRYLVPSAFGHILRKVVCVVNELEQQAHVAFFADHKQTRANQAGIGGECQPAANLKKCTKSCLQTATHIQTSMRLQGEGATNLVEQERLVPVGTHPIGAQIKCRRGQRQNVLNRR